MYSFLGDLDTVVGLEKELSNAKEELELMAKKERESRVSFLVKPNFLIPVFFKILHI